MRKFTIALTLVVFVLALCSSRVQAASGPPAITSQPTNQTVVSGASVGFSVAVDGTPPFSYQWQWNGSALLGATNATLSFPSVSFTQSGAYSVSVTNSFGSLTSTSAFLLVDPQLTFRVTALRTNGAIVVDHDALTGDDRGGIAVSASTVFVTGDNATARFNAEFLTGGVSLGNGTIYDGMVTDLKTETIYLLASGTNILNNSGGTLDNLVQIDGATGALTAQRVILSTNILLQNSGNIGLFSGYGRIVIHLGFEAYDISMPSGRVTYLGFTQFLPHNFSESWAYWGVAEYLAGNIYVLFAESPTTIGRARLPSGAVSTAASFISFSDMASFTVSPSRSRWFFHYEGSGQLGGVSETLGSAKALYSTDPGFPSIYLDPVGQSVYPGSNVTLTVAAIGANPLYYQWRLNGTNIPAATNISYTLSNPDTNSEGTYSVSVSNTVGGALSGDAFISLITTPFILQNPFSISTYPGSNALFYALADGAPPLFYQWLVNGVEIPGATNSIIVLTNLQPSQEGAYMLQVSNSYGLAFSESANLSIRGQPVILSPPVSRSVNAGSSASFTVTADGAPPLRYQWGFNGTNIIGATNRTLGLSQVQPAQAGSYSITISNIYGTISASADLSVITVPTIVTDPADQSVVQGELASFRVAAKGPGPLRYQWRLNGADLPNATNNLLVLSNVQPADAGTYSVLVFNNYGSILSAPATLSLFPVYPEGATFRIVSLTPNNARVIEHNNFTGDDRGGIAASLQSIFVTGDNSTARFGLDLSNAFVLNQNYDTICANLRNGKIYLLASNDIPFFYGSASSGVFTHALEIDASTGLPSGNRIALSSTIPFSTSGGQCGIFSGFDRILFHNKTNVYGILLPSGTVTNYGAMASPTHSSSESWAYWGVAENFGGNTYITYVRNSTTISRTRVPDAVTTTLNGFSALSDMASFTVSLYSNRWYFHYEGSGQFGGGDENLGYASAVFDVNPVDHFDWTPIPPVQSVNTPFTVTITAKTVKGATVTSFNGSVSIIGTNTTGGGTVPVSPTFSGNFTNGVWSGTISALQPSTSMYLQALSSAGNSGLSSQFTVLPANDIWLAMTDSPDPVPLNTTLTYGILVSNTGPNVATSVLVDDVLPPNIIVQSALSTQGACTIYTNAIICDLGNMAAGAGAAVTITALPNVTGRLTNQVTIYRGEADGTLANNSAVAVTTVTLPQLSISDATLIEGNSGTNDMIFNVSLFPASTNTVRINFTMNNIGATRDVDFVFRSSSLTFNPGQTNQNINIGIIGDNMYEPDETFSVQLFLPNNAFIARGLGIGTILNDDPVPSIRVPNISITEGNTGTNFAIFQVSLSGRSALPVTVNYSTSDGTAKTGSDYFGATNTITFPAGTSVLTQGVLIPILGDSVVEANETFFLNVLSAVNATSSGLSGMGTILNDDGAGVLHHFTWGALATQQMVNASFPVTISARDALENTLSNFNQSVHLQAGKGTVSDPQHMIEDDTFPFSSTGDYTIGFQFTPSVDMTVISVRHYVGVQVSIWSDLGELLATQPVLSTVGTWTETPLDFPVTLPAGVPYRVAFYTGVGGEYVYSTNIPSTFADGTIDNIYYNIGDAFPSNLTIGALFPVDLVYSAGDALQPLSITPTNTGAFQNGSWSGEITFLEPGSGVRLFAADDAGHKGQSEMFDVIGNNLRISEVLILGSDVHIMFQGTAGTNYRLERNDTLQPNGWTSVASVSPSSNQPVDLIDNGGASVPSRFYRISVDP